MTEPLTPTRLDEIDTRAGYLHEYGTLTDGPLQADLDQLAGVDVPAMAAELRRLTTALDEMTHLRDNALRALYRDDVDTDIDLEETIAAPFYGPGWDWDEHDLTPVVKEAADAVRPAFGKLTQQRDQARDIAVALEQETAHQAVQIDRVRAWAISHEYRWLHELLDGYGTHGGWL
ncbi:hypothetical protein [Streptomyces sp. NPDC005799]|uniref:hypothetical protein n=1 Tax=Streptomyces sp. NPDC005799 TaxID=3154678 RepID=UPI003409881C